MKYFKILAVDTGASTYILSIAKLLPTDVVGFNIAIAIWWIRAAVDLADWRSVVLRFQSKMEGSLHIMSQFATLISLIPPHSAFLCPPIHFLFTMGHNACASLIYSMRFCEI